MKALLVLVALCNSCAYGAHVAYNREEVVKYGFHARYVDNAIQTTDDINYVIWTLVYEFAARGANINELIGLLNKHSEDYPIYVVEKEFKCESGYRGRCMGEFLAGAPFIYNGSIMFVQNKCVGLSPLAHEFIHLVDHLVNDKRDFMHQNSAYFEVGCLWKYKRGSSDVRECINKSIERTVNKKLCDQVCGGCTTEQLDWQFSDPP